MGIMSRLNVPDPATVNFSFKAVNSPRFIGKTTCFSFWSDKTPEDLAIATKRLRDNFGEPLLVNEDGTNIPYYVVRATANTGKKVLLAVCLYEGLMVMTKDNSEFVRMALKKFGDFLYEESND